MLELNHPITYEQWKQAAMNHKQNYIHMKAQLKAHYGGFTLSRPHGWAPQRMLTDPNAMDTSAGRTCGRVTGSEEMNPTNMPCGGYIP